MVTGLEWGSGALAPSASSLSCLLSWSETGPLSLLLVTEVTCEKHLVNFTAASGSYS